MQTIITRDNKAFFVDYNAKQLTFLDKRFYLTENGVYLPSVTTILDAYPKGAQFFEWLKKMGEDADEVRDDAGNTGSTVHRLCEDYDLGKTVSCLTANGEIAFKLHEWAMFERYVEFRRRFPVVMKMVEVQAMDEELGYAGTLDRIFEFDGLTWLVDIKTSNYLHPHFWLQQAAYRAMFEKKGIKIDRVGILWLNAKTRSDGKKDTIQGPGWQLLHREDSTKDMELFNATFKLWQAEFGTMKPKNVIYSLYHTLNDSIAEAKGEPVV